MKDLVRSLSSSDLINNTPEDCIECFISRIQKIEETAFPLENRSNHKRFCKRWMTRGIFESIRDRDKLFSDIEYVTKQANDL